MATLIDILGPGLGGKEQTRLEGEGTRLGRGGDHVREGDKARTVRGPG